MPHPCKIGVWRSYNQKQNNMEKFELLWQLSKIADNACYGYLYDTANRFYDKVKANYNNKRLVKEATAFVKTYKDY